jgi:hypothetical protein
LVQVPKKTELKIGYIYKMAAKKYSSVNNHPTLFIVFLLGIIIYLGYRLSATKRLGSSIKKNNNYLDNILTRTQNDIRNDLSRCGANGGDPMSNAYVPPVKCDAGGLLNNPLTMSIPMNSVAINVPTQPYNVQYAQVGILTKRYGNNNEILPLMGRRTVTSRSKWQYYTVSGGGGNGGNLQAKLPVKVGGKTCSNEYGCDEVNSGDDVYVEGFQDMFQATIYESGMFSYIPV